MARNTRAPARPRGSGRPGARTLGLETDDPVAIIHMVRAGFPFKRLLRLQKATGLSSEELARIVGIPQRTLARRQRERRLRSDESDRVWRISRIFDMALDLFEGDGAAATRWLRTPQVGLGDESPLELASTELGAREVEQLIGRLEYGVIT